MTVVMQITITFTLPQMTKMEGLPTHNVRHLHKTYIKNTFQQQEYWQNDIHPTLPMKVHGLTDN